LTAETAPSRRAAGVVDARAASNGEQPAPCGPVATEAVDGADRPLVGFLGEIVRVVPIAEVPAHPPHISLGLGHETFERPPIAVLGGDEEPGQVIHRPPLSQVGNQNGSNGDRARVTCDDVRELLSAQLDGEATSMEKGVVDEHLAMCVGCQTYATRLDLLERSIRVRPAEAVPDLVASVVTRARPARLGRGGWLRPALAWVAIVMFVQSVPALVLGEASGADSHLARHLGAFGAALAIGFAYAAWKPHRAFGLLPFTAALVATTLVSAIADAATGGREVLGETVHVVEVVGLVLLWVIAGSPGWPVRSLRRDDPHAPRSGRAPSPTS
jgi:predicted anti-sigma-YlaC factor YlaD